MCQDRGLWRKGERILKRVRNRRSWQPEAKEEGWGVGNDKILVEPNGPKFFHIFH